MMGRQGHGIQDWPAGGLPVRGTTRHVDLLSQAYLPALLALPDDICLHCCFTVSDSDVLMINDSSHGLRSIM